MFFQLFSIFIFFGFLELKFYIIKNKALKTKWEMNVTDLLETFEFRKNSSKKNLISCIWNAYVVLWNKGSLIHVMHFEGYLWLTSTELLIFKIQMIIFSESDEI